MAPNDDHDLRLVLLDSKSSSIREDEVLEGKQTHREQIVPHFIFDT